MRPIEEATRELVSVRETKNDLDYLKYTLGLSQINKAVFVEQKPIDANKILGHWEVVFHFIRTSWGRKQFGTLAVRSYFDSKTYGHIYTIFGKDCYVGSLADALKSVAEKTNEYLTEKKDIRDFSEIIYR